MRNHNTTVIALILVGALTFITLFYCPAAAEDDETLKLRQRVAELESKVTELENTLKAYINAGVNENETEMGWLNKNNWRRLKAGMNKEQVQSILGEPVKTIKGVRTLWYYPNIYRGFVSFDDKGRLTRWNEP